MIKTFSVAAAAAITSLFIPSRQQPQEDPRLQNRVEALEKWKSTAETRLQTLESSLNARGKPTSLAPSDAAEQVLTVAITSKWFDPSRTGSDPNNWKFEDNVWWDATYTATGLQKEARSIKGILKFCDLFGDPQFQVRVTLNDPIKPGGKLKVDGIGIKYNQFEASHKWLRSTDIEDMTVRFQVLTILYKDGATEKFGS